MGATPNWDHGQSYDPQKGGIGVRYLNGGNFSSTIDISGDNKTIAYASLKWESSEICIMNIDGSGFTRLTNSPYWKRDPSFSPDGQNVLFLSDQDDYDGEPYLVNVRDYGIKRFALNCSM